MPTARHGWGKVSLSEVKAPGGAWTGTCVCRALRIASPPPPQVLGEHKHGRNQGWAHFPDSPCGSRQPCRDPPSLPSGSKAGPATPGRAEGRGAAVCCLPVGPSPSPSLHSH